MDAIEREEMDVGVLFVGAGPATLAGAIHLADQVEAYNEQVESGAIEGEPIDLEELPIMVIEKGAMIGDQVLSGACIDPRAFDELFDDEFLAENPPPFDGPVTKDALVALLPTPPSDADAIKNPIKRALTRLWQGIDKRFVPKNRAIEAPILPPTFHNEGNKLASLNELVKWMAEVAEEKGVMIMPEFPGADLLIEDGRVVGVRTGDKGVDKHGKAKGNFEPGTDLKARLVILGEGARGSLTKLLIKKYGLDDDANHQLYSTGVKEVWKLPTGRIQPGEVIHTAGYPLPFDTFGGGFIYGLTDNRVSLGLVTALDSPDPYLDPHRKFNEWKAHPFLKALLEGGEMEKYGAKTIPEGGWFSLPKPFAPGALLVGDSAGFVNISRLKGIHLAMKSGMLAAETAFASLKGSEDVEAGYWHRILNSWIFEELWVVRNFRQAFQRRFLGLPEMVTGSLHAGLGFIAAGALLVCGLLSVTGAAGYLIDGLLGVLGIGGLPFSLTIPGLIMIVLSFLVGAASMPLGFFPLGRLSVLADHERMRRIAIGKWSRRSKSSDPVPAPRLPGISAAAEQVQFNAEHPTSPAPRSPIDAQAPAASINSNGIQFDKVTSVYHAGSIHEEDQPPHLVVADQSVCHTRCAEEYGNPCQYFCPAAVYEMVESDNGQGRRLQLNFSNCVHCKTCDVRDPYQIITWVPPEGGGGPSYTGL